MGRRALLTREEKLAKRREFYAKNKEKIAQQKKARRERQIAEGTYVPPKPTTRPPGYQVDIRTNPDFDAIVKAISDEDIERGGPYLA